MGKIQLLQIETHMQVVVDLLSQNVSLKKNKEKKIEVTWEGQLLSYVIQIKS